MKYLAEYIHELSQKVAHVQFLCMEQLCHIIYRSYQIFSLKANGLQFSLQFKMFWIEHEWYPLFGDPVGCINAHFQLSHVKLIHFLSPLSIAQATNG